MAPWPIMGYWDRLWGGEVPSFYLLSWIFLFQHYFSINTQKTERANRHKKQTIYTHKHHHRPCNQMLKSNFSCHIYVKECDRESTISAARKRAFCDSNDCDKSNKTLSAFPAVTDVHCLFSFEACTSIIVHKLPFIFSQDTLLTISGQSCVL